MAIQASDFHQAFSDDELAPHAKAAGISVQEYREGYEKTIGDPANRRHISVTGTEVPEEEEEDCKTYEFEVSLFKFLGVKGKVKICNAGRPDWSATLSMCIILLGNEVICQDAISLSPSHAEVCFGPNVGAAKANLCFGIRSGNCLYVKGKACYWALSWHCTDFDETIHCF